MISLKNIVKTYEMGNETIHALDDVDFHINPNEYIQHNLMVADGLEGFGEVLKQLPEGSAKARVARAFQDGDYVFTHTEYNF